MTSNPINPQEKLLSRFNDVIDQFIRESDISEDSINQMREKFSKLDDDGKAQLVKNLFDSLDQSVQDSYYFNEYNRQKQAATAFYNIRAEGEALLNFYADKYQEEADNAKLELNELEKQIANNEKLYNLNNNRSIQSGQPLQLSDLINPNGSNQPQPKTTFTQSASLANEAKDQTKSENYYPNLPPLNSAITVPPTQKVPFPSQTQSNINYPNPAFQPNKPLPQQAQSVQNSGQFYPVNNATTQAQSYPQAPLPAPRPVWRPGSNLVKPPSSSN